MMRKIALLGAMVLVCLAVISVDWTGGAGVALQGAMAEEEKTYTVTSKHTDTTHGAYNTYRWELSEDGTLTISGTGFVENLLEGPGSVRYPRFNWTSAKKIVIEPGITRIGMAAFLNCSDVTSVSIPKSLKTVDDYAFINCSSIKTVYYDGSINDWWNIKIDKTKNEVFYNVKVVTPVRPGSGTYGSYRWRMSDDGTLTISGTGVVDNCIFNHEDGSWTYRFDWSGARSVVVEPGITGLEMATFGHCESLTSVSLPDTLERIGDYAFFNCTSLTDIVIPERVAALGSSAFYLCTSLESINIPKGVTYADVQLFLDCVRLKNVVLPSGVTGIDWAAFESCTSLVSVSIPRSVKMIDHEAFLNCRSLRTVYYEGTQAEWNAIEIDEQGNDALLSASFVFGSAAPETTVPEPQTPGTETSGDFTSPYGTYHWVLSADGTLTITGTGELTNIIEGDDAPATPEFDWSRAKRAVISSGITVIGDLAFKWSPNLVSVSLPQTLTEFGFFAFAGCSQLAEIELPQGMTRIGPGALQDCKSLKKVNIPDSVKTIEAYAFNNCTSLTEMTIPDRVAKIDTGVFEGCSALSVVRIPHGVTTICEDAFKDCVSLRKVYYDGTQAEWDAIAVDQRGNQALFAAELILKADAAIKAPQAESGQSGMIISKNGSDISLRSSKSKSKDALIMTLKPGTVVQVQSWDRDWVEVTYQGTSGFVQRSNCHVPGDPIYRAVVKPVSGVHVYLRAQNSREKNNIILEFTADTEVLVYATYGDWCEVICGEHQHGYVMKKYVQIGEKMTEAPETTTPSEPTKSKRVPSVVAQRYYHFTDEGMDDPEYASLEYADVGYTDSGLPYVYANPHEVGYMQWASNGVRWHLNWQYLLNDCEETIPVSGENKFLLYDCVWDEEHLDDTEATDDEITSWTYHRYSGKPHAYFEWGDTFVHEYNDSGCFFYFSTDPDDARQHYYQHAKATQWTIGESTGEEQAEEPGDQTYEVLEVEAEDPSQKDWDDAALLSWMKEQTWGVSQGGAEGQDQPAPGEQALEEIAGAMQEQLTTHTPDATTPGSTGSAQGKRVPNFAARQYYAFTDENADEPYLDEVQVGYTSAGMPFIRANRSHAIGYRQWAPNGMRWYMNWMAVLDECDETVPVAGENKCLLYACIWDESHMDDTEAYDEMADWAYHRLSDTPYGCIEWGNSFIHEYSADECIFYLSTDPEDARRHYYQHVKQTPEGYEEKTEEEQVTAPGGQTQEMIEVEAKDPSQKGWDDAAIMSWMKEQTWGDQPGELQGGTGEQAYTVPGEQTLEEITGAMQEQLSTHMVEAVTPEQPSPTAPGPQAQETETHTVTWLTEQEYAQLTGQFQTPAWIEDMPAEEEQGTLQQEISDSYLTSIGELTDEADDAAMYALYLSGADPEKDDALLRWLQKHPELWSAGDQGTTYVGDPGTADQDRYDHQRTEGYGLVVSDNGFCNNLRSAPTTAEDNIVTTIDPGTWVKVLEVQNGWCRISWNGKTGYMLRSYVHLPSDPVYSAAVRLKQGANVFFRSKPKKREDTIIYEFTSRKNVEVYAIYDDWYEIMVDGVHGYLVRGYLNFQAGYDPGVTEYVYQNK